MSTAQIGKEERGGWKTEGRKPSGTFTALVRHTLGLQTRGVLIWGLVVGLYGAAMTATFTTFAADAEQMDQILEIYPQSMLDAFGISSLGTIEAFLDSQFFYLAPLALAFFTILAAASAIAGAEERGSIDVLLGNPLPRWQLVVGNFLATALSFVAILAIAGALTWVTALLVDVDLTLATTTEAFLNLWPICMFFGGVALLGSTIFHRRVLAIAVPGFLLFVMFMMNVMGNVSEDLEYLQPYSVFYYYGQVATDGMDWANFAGITGVVLVLVVLAVLVFRRRDIYT
ncbi:MAG: ABC transporter permease subunit [Rubrobacteraceae bacterium]